MSLWKARRLIAVQAVALLLLGAAAQAQSAGQVARNDDAIRLSEFGERPDFSPDGKRLAIVGKSYGDAYEIDIASRTVRNLTAHTPHQGVLRIQYLPTGDYLINAPRVSDDRTARFSSELWVLDKAAKGPLMPLGVKLFEGAAVSRSGSRLAWVEYGANFVKPGLVDGKMKFTMNPEAELVLMTGDLVLGKGAPQVVNRRELLRRKQRECFLIEPQDFRRNDSELVFNCYPFKVQAVDLTSGAVAEYWNAGANYVEAEGMASDGKTMLVECGGPPNDRGAFIDICLLEMKPGGARRKLIAEPRPSTRMSTNPVFSPDGDWIAFSDADRMDEAGVGRGILLIRTPTGAPLTP